MPEGWLTVGDAVDNVQSANSTLVPQHIVSFRLQLPDILWLLWSAAYMPLPGRVSMAFFNFFHRVGLLGRDRT